MLWFKTFHILFVMAWMAGVFYLPRILVHYVEGPIEAVMDQDWSWRRRDGSLILTEECHEPVV